MKPGNVVICDVCRVVAPGERAELRALGWMPMPKKGQREERWAWRCPKCAPKGSTNLGRSTT